jgi:hypothetical protein
MRPKILLDGKNWLDLKGEAWSDVKRALLDHYGTASDRFGHDVSFITDMLCAMFNTMVVSNSLPRPLVLGIDRAIARLEYFQKRGTGGKDDTKTAGAKAAALEARLIERDLPDHIRRNRKEVEKRSF